MHDYNDEIRDFDDEILDFDNTPEDAEEKTIGTPETNTPPKDNTRRKQRRALSERQRPRKAKSGNPLTVITVILSVTTLVSLILCVFVISKFSAVPASSDEVIEEVSYTQEDVDAMIASASSNAAMQQEEQLRAEIRSYLEIPNPSTADMLRHFYSDHILYLDSEGYHFIPISDTIPRHEYAAENFTVSENNIITYTENGETVSKMVLDVSQHQGTIDWAQVAAFGVDAAIIRVGIRGYGSGALVLDERFVENMEGATAAGLEVGVYFFSQAINETELLEETEFIFEAIAPYNITYPVVIDVEKIENDTARADALGASERTALVRLFCDTVAARGYTPMIYGNTYSLFSMLEIENIQDYEIWYAFYNDYLYYPYPVRMWQYTANATVPGIEGVADLNIWLP